MFNYLANPHRFLKFARYAAPIFAVIAALSLGFGLWHGLVLSPPVPDQGGEIVRVFYVHVPAAWCAMMAYTILAVASLISFIWRHPLADIGARAIAVPGAAFTFLTLITGAIWGKPTWGTWWQWDGRMTSVLILFIIYLAYISLWSVIPDKKRASKLAGILAMVGFVNIPIIKFSVEWWNSLHQPATLSKIGAPGLPAEMLYPLFGMLIGYSSLLGWIVVKRMVNDIRTEQVRRKTRKPGATLEVEKI